MGTASRRRQAPRKAAPAAARNAATSKVSGVDITKLVGHHADPLSALADLRELRTELEQWQAVYVRRARRHGSSWTEIGYHLGVSAQAVQKRYGAAVAG
jgi:hypothetical protein